MPADTALDTAWAALDEGIEALRRRGLASPLAADPADRARLHLWLLQARAMVHNLAVAPDWVCPTLLTGTVFEPNTYGWLMPNPDFFYRYAFLDGARSYRIEGRLGSAHFLEGQVISGFWGDPAIRLLKNYDFADFARGADGSIAVTVGPVAPADGGNWIATDPAGAPNTLILRECFNDWQGERQAFLRIRPLDGAVSAFDPDGPELALRLESGLRLVRFAYDVFGGAVTQQVLDAVGPNRFRLLDTSRDGDGANPSAGYVPAVYDLAEDDALLIDIEVPRARYWSLHLGDVWMQVSDFVHHQSSLNGHQIRLDPDGHARLVIAARDPGIANWLDPVGRLKGVGILRWYFSDRSPVPQTRVVKAAELPGHLPDGTARVEPAERARILAARREAVLARYGH
jgi:hypothetical protein